MRAAFVFLVIIFGVIDHFVVEITIESSYLLPNVLKSAYLPII